MARTFHPTELDRRLLELAAEHRVVLPGHAAVHLGCSLAAAAWRLRRLRAAKLIAPREDYYSIRTAGLRAIGSRYRAPRPDANETKHDAGLAWLWLAARAGAYGPAAEVISERQMRSVDAVARGGAAGRDDGDAAGWDDGDAAGRGAGDGSREEPFGVRLGGYDARGNPRLHYPDLLLVTPRGHRIAFELELGSKERKRREDILAGYASDPKIDAVVYLFDKPSVARAVRASARRLGISALVHTQSISWGPGALPKRVEHETQRAHESARAGRGRTVEGR